MAKILIITVVCCAAIWLMLVIGALAYTKRSAQSIFPDMNISRVLKWKPSHGGPFGCTYLVIRLSQNAAMTPPRVVIPERGYKSRFAKDGAWRPTPVPADVDLNDRGRCLSGWPNGSDFDGAKLDGYGPKLAEILRLPGAWFSLYGKGEHQVLMIYAPKQRVAMRLRFGD